MNTVIVKNKKPIPYKYFNEVCCELARGYFDAKYAPTRQQKRIDEVIASGLDYEVMQGGAGYSWQIPLSQLQGFLADALAVDVDAKLKSWQDFKAKHKGVKGLNGNLRAAKIEAELKKTKNPKFSDANVYDYFGTMVNRHYLSNKQSDEFMAYCMEIEIL